MSTRQARCSFILTFISLAILMGTSGASNSQRWESHYLRNNLIELQVVPEIGGRVIQCKLGSYSFFWVNEQLVDMKPPVSGVGPNGEWLDYGGDKLWPASQGWDNDQQWPGPPDAVLDGGLYEANLILKDGKANVIELISQKDERCGIQFSRTIKIFEHTTHVSIDATMKNVDNKPRRWGIWAHTQFNAGNRHGSGYNKNYWAYCPLNTKSVFRKGYNILFGLVNNPSFKPDYENGMMRVHYERLVGKAGVDSPAGWVATVDATDGYVFVQRFTYEPDKDYPDDSSVEFWVSGLGEFIAWGKINKMPEDSKGNPHNFESEILSPYANLSPGESYTFHYDWYTARIPSGFPVIACNDIGVTCESPVAKLKDGQLYLSGKFGIFYRGYISFMFFNNSNQKIEFSSPEIPVTPLQPLDLSVLSAKTAGIKVPGYADTVAISLRNKKGQFIGELARIKLIKIQ